MNKGDIEAVFFQDEENFYYYSNNKSGELLYVYY